MVPNIAIDVSIKLMNRNYIEITRRSRSKLYKKLLRYLDPLYFFCKTKFVLKSKMQLKTNSELNGPE